MRIYSNFKDYYDIGLQNHDASIVYERNTVVIEDSVKYPRFLRSAIAEWWDLAQYNVSSHVYVVCNDVFYVLSFNEAYRGATAMRNIPFGSYVFPSFLDFSNHVESLTDWYFRESEDTDFIATMRKLQFKYRSPIVHASVSHESRGGSKIEINAKLSSVSFPSIVDPYQMYQKIEMFLANDLAEELNPPAKIDDKYRIPAHGFDKWSFRKKGTRSK